MPAGISAYDISALLLAVWLQITLRGMTGRGLLYWTIHALIAVYAASLLARRCFSRGWQNVPARYAAEIVATRAQFMTAGGYRPRAAFRPAQ